MSAEDVRESLNGAGEFEDKDSKRWAQKIVDQHEQQMIGKEPDITVASKSDYLRAAAIFALDEDGSYFAGLRRRLKDRGVVIKRWDQKVKECEYKIRAERKAREAAQKAV